MGLTGLTIVYDNTAPTCVDDTTTTFTLSPVSTGDNHQNDTPNDIATTLVLLQGETTTTTTTTSWAASAAAGIDDNDNDNDLGSHMD